MVRKVKDKYGVWLVGYYDDFNGARAIPSDYNTPELSWTATTSSNGSTHFGNPLNGEATLNPRYRWCYWDRATSGSHHHGAYGGTSDATQPYLFSLSTNKLLHNKGVYEWLSYDGIRNHSARQMGRARLQYPDGHTNSTKFRTFPRTNNDPQPGDAFQEFCNGHNTLGRYVIPTGDLDSSFGRQDMTGYNDNTTYKAGNSGKNSWVRLSTMEGTGSGINGNTSTLTMVRRAHLAGRWMGETLIYTDAAITDQRPKNIFAPLESPSGMPFLCVQQYNRTGDNSTPYLPTIYYDGDLHSRDTNDILSFRLAVRSFNGAGKVTPKLTIKAGYTATSPNIGSKEDGLTGTPVISFDVDLTGYDTNPHLYSGNTTKATYVNDDSWIDVDVHLDYDTQKFTVYQDGNKKSGPTAFTGSNIKAENMYGWQMYMHPVSGSNNVSSTLMLDRAALYRPLTDDPTGKDLPPLREMEIQSAINGFSGLSLTLEDDASDYETIDNYGFSTDNYAHNFTSLFSGNKLSDWGIVLFAGGGGTGDISIPHINRPVWRGFLQSIDISEKRQGRVININAHDSLTAMDKQIPMWELGQNNNSGTTHTPYWSLGTEGLLEVMDMGISTLKQFSGRLGRDFANSYENRADQRTQLRSSHPIQIYNNEDEFGPNSLWRDFEGMGIDAYYKDNTGLRLILSGNPNIGASGNITIDYTGRAVLDKSTLAITAHHSMNEAGDIVTYSSTDPHEVLTVAIGTGSGEANWSEEYDNLCYVGKYIGPSKEMDSTMSFTNNAGADMERYQKYAEFIDNHPATFENGRASIERLRIINRGQGYTEANGYYTTVDGENINKGTITMPTPTNTTSNPNWVGETAEAEWETAHYHSYGAFRFVNEANAQWNTGIIQHARITNPGRGYSGGNAQFDAWFNTDRIFAGQAHANDGIKTVLQLSVKKRAFSGGSEANLVGDDYDDIVAQSPNGDGIYHCSIPWVVGQIPVNTTFDETDTGVNNEITNDTGSGTNAVVRLQFYNSGLNQDTVEATIINGGKGYAIDDVIKCKINLWDTDNSDSEVVFVRLKVTALADDFKAEPIFAEQANTDYLTFCFTTSINGVDSTSFPLRVGDDFVISNTETSTDLATNAGARNAIRGRHTVRSIKKILNVHGNPRQPANKQRYLWQVQTYTPLPDGWQDGLIGDFNEKYGLLDHSVYWGNPSTTQLTWSPVRSAVITSALPASHTENIKDRPIHAKWMQDLPMSLYFQYNFAQIQYTPIDTSNLVSAVTAGDTEIEITQAMFEDNSIPNAGVAVIQQPQMSLSYEERQDLNDFFIYRCKYYAGGNKWYLGDCQFVNANHPTTAPAYTINGLSTSNPTQLHIVNYSDSYKHLWVLWADMRNDGTADADGGLRKKDFGLKSPVIDNYSLKIQFEDQVDENGEYVEFTELKMNDDYDIWGFDATSDPSTSGAYSKPLNYDQSVAFSGNMISIVSGNLSINKTGHNLTTSDRVGLINCGSLKGVYKVKTITDANNFILDLPLSSIPSDFTANNIMKHFYAATRGTDTTGAPTWYADWEDKGGAFIIIDTSKFFNLNTIANKGMVNQEGGGQTDLGDYFAVGVGDPVLIDSYYRNAASTSLTTDNDYHKHTNLSKLVTGKSSLVGGLEKGQFWLVPQDLTIFDDNGIGRLLGSKIGSDIRSEWFFQWNGKITADKTVSSVTVTTPSVGDEYWVLTKTGSTFITDGLRAGAYIKNTSKPLVKGVGDSWKTTDVQTHYYRIKKVVSETVLWVERVIYYDFTQALSTGEEDNNLSFGLYRRDGLTQDDIDDGWATGHNFTIPAQLYNVALDSITIATTDSTWTESGIENLLTEALQDFVSAGGTALPHVRTQVSNVLWPVLNVYNNVSNEYAYRLMMKLDGQYLNLNGGTFYNSDKLRTLWNNSIATTWLSKTKLTSMFDINNVPLSEGMTTYNTNTEEDSFGGILNTISKPIMDSVKKTQKSSSVGYNNSLFTSFSWLIGRDNRLDFRPKYNSGYSFTRNDVMVSEFAMSQSERVDYVRCIYNDGNSFVDFPAPAIGDATSWKIIDHPEILNRIEASYMAEQEYNSRKKNPIALTIEPRRLMDYDMDAMLSGGRYGYIADAQMATQGDADDSNNLAWCWTVQGTGGVLFPGMVNGLDGNLGSVVTSSNLYDRYGKSFLSEAATIAHEANYTTYGSRSVSYAVQITHVAKDIPKVSAATGEKMRVVVALKPDQTGKDIDNALFRVYLLDTYFESGPSSSTISPDMKGYVKTLSYVDCKYNGFYEIDVPSSYYSSGKIIISFNADYCRDLLRTRCGWVDKQMNSNDVILTNGQTTIGYADGNADDEVSPITIAPAVYNTESIFPLGCRLYSAFKGGMGASRHLWYAPALHIVEDINYVPATYVKYTDAGFDINDLTMIVSHVDWSVNADKGERVKLRLREDESRGALGIMDYIFAPPKLPNPTTSSGGNNSAVAPPNVDNLTTEVDEGVGAGTPINSNWVDTSAWPSQAGQGVGWGFGIATSSGGSGQSNDSLNINSLRRSTYKALKKKMLDGGSEFTAQYGNNILGQTKTSTTPASMRGMTGPLRVQPILGSASSTNDGFTLPGKGKSEGIGAGETAFAKEEVEHKVEIEMKTPKDAISDEINITADIKLPSTANLDKTASLKVQAKCLETGAEFSEILNIPTGTTKSNMQLASTTSLNGAGTSGNTIVFTFSRTPGMGADTANYSTITVSNVDINFKRAAFSADNRSNIFLPYR